MTVSLRTSRDEFTERIVSDLWGEWSAFGVAGYARSSHSWVIDPEALLLLTTRFGRYDARLFDEVCDWLRGNGHALSVQRLRHLMKAHPCGEPTVLAAMTERLAEESSHAKWKTIRRLVTAPEGVDPRPLFPSSEFFGEAEPVFRRWGWLRGPVEFRGMSQAPQPDQPATFLFKLRALFGNQARAEVVAWLLAHERGHPAEIARQTGYFRRSIQLVLNELAASGHVRVLRMGREKHFFVRHAEWRFLLTWPNAKVFPRWVCWAPLFQAITIFHEALSIPGLEDRSERVQAMQLREALDEGLPSLAAADLAHRFESIRGQKGGEFIRSLLAELDTMLP